ncbi:hypothetical protein [Photobacterium profundum]|uniref:Uncharacterized protein n=1 Tax=Photobacterium profundum (strain SS9) TaxID=298386 RepID=Q6LGZ4_PHOPR|nr:hypothetical protein [Photobacterium profundum]CAG23436.1 Hypothetical protein PBPRB1574 [Photobacterium profundum SS9]
MESTVVLLVELGNSAIYSTNVGARTHKLNTHLKQSRYSAIDELLTLSNIAAKGSVILKDIQVREQSGDHTEYTIYASYLPAFIDVTVEAERNKHGFSYYVEVAGVGHEYSASHAVKARDIALMSLRTHKPDIKDFEITLIDKETEKMPSEIELDEFSSVYMTARVIV